MAKLKLELESLRVDSFTTSPGRASSKGTVRGHSEALTQFATCTQYNTFWCTAPSSQGPYACSETDALSCPQKPKAEIGGVVTM